jgi:WD40 repeat protein
MTRKKLTNTLHSILIINDASDAVFHPSSSRSAHPHSATEDSTDNAIRPRPGHCSSRAKERRLRLVRIVESKGEEAVGCQLGAHVGAREVRALPPPTFTQAPLMPFYRLDSVVCCVKFSFDGKFLATGCNRTAQIYDTTTGQKTWSVRQNALLPDALT